jgi:hypothetical protein
MSDEPTSYERKLRALTLDQLRTSLADLDALIELHGHVVKVRGHLPQALVAEILGMHWSRIYQIRREWPGNRAKWKAQREKLVARIAELSDE